MPPLDELRLMAPLLGPPDFEETTVVSVPLTEATLRGLIRAMDRVEATRQELGVQRADLTLAADDAAFHRLVAADAWVDDLEVLASWEEAVWQRDTYRRDTPVREDLLDLLVAAHLPTASFSVASRWVRLNTQLDHDAPTSLSMHFTRADLNRYLCYLVDDREVVAIMRQMSEDSPRTLLDLLDDGFGVVGVRPHDERPMVELPPDVAAVLLGHEDSRVRSRALSVLEGVRPSEPGARSGPSL